MRYLLDTVVVSEPARPSPDRGAIAWLEAQSGLDLAISVLTLGEIQRGVDRLADGRRKNALQSWLTRDLQAQFDGRIFPIDLDVSLAWGTLTSDGERMGRPLQVIDGLLLATARVHGLTVVTRNTRDFEHRGVPVLNPYGA